ncbi:MAG: SDR family NAD(P)-dependent oxidoreductase [Gemmatimonadales bacterium]
MNIRQILRNALWKQPATPAARADPPAEIPVHRGLVQGQTAVVVGAGPNTGQGIASVLGSEGARLLVTNASGADLGQVLDSLREAGLDAAKLEGDITSSRDTAALLAMLDRLGWTPDILVLNVGVHSREGAESLGESERVFRTNVAGPLWLARQVAERMRTRSTPGAIIFISSIHQQLWRGDASYSGSKAALTMAMRELALELVPAGIRINGVAPGWVAADADGRPVPHRLTPLYQTSTPPAAIGQAVVFLASRVMSGHMTGAVLTVDGGATLASYATPPLPALPAE